MRYLFLSLCLASCAVVPRPVGHDFPITAFERFNLNQTSTEEVEAVLGAPWRQSSFRGLAKPDSKFIRPGTPIATTTLNYMYAPAGAGLPLQNHPLKMANLVFLNGRLVAYDCNSLIAGEKPPAFDESRLGDLQQGITTKAQALALFGVPTGQSLHILDAQAGDTEVAYNAISANGNIISRHVLTLSFNKMGLLKTYTVLDNSFPLGAGPIPMPFQAPAPPKPATPPHNQIPPADLSHT